MDHGTILLVEDNEDDAILLKRAFKKNNMPNEIVRAKDGVEAVNLLFGWEGVTRIVPSLVILDLKLPRINGLEVLKLVRSNDLTRGLPIVILTTSAEQHDIVQGYELGTNSYIRKPVEFEKFILAIGQLGLYWMVLNEPNPKFSHE